MANDVQQPGKLAFRNIDERFAADRRRARAKKAVNARWSPTERARRLGAALETLERAVYGDKRAKAEHKLAILTLRSFLLPPGSAS